MTRSSASSASARTSSRSPSAAPWLDEHLPGIEQVPVSSNAEGARRARDEQGTAAIAGETAAEVYGLQVLAAADRGPRRQHDALPRARPQALRARAARIAPRYCCRSAIPTRPGALFRLLEPLRAPPHQHDAHRVAAVAAAQVGLRVLHRPRGTRGRAAVARGARGAEEARLAVSPAGLLPARGAVSSAARRGLPGRSRCAAVAAASPCPATSRSRIAR